ncbi:hypothetical protein PDJAM_G00127530 [Pangasius djambal]|uniref:Uncharacterized protein n=1 Tax=Pangasius djambal TaxID=1691987 RepID=A0ACC5ZBJ7_9TELE|nr:hypothetical protein [Pangasius djambal]
MCVYSAGETLIHWYLVALILLLVILVIIITCMLRKKCKDQIRTRDRSNDTTVHTPTLTDEDSITYSTVAVSKPKVSPNNVDDEAIYSNMVYQ